VIDINQITVQVQMGIPAHLDRCICRDSSSGARREGYLCKEAERRNEDLRDGLRSEGLIVAVYHFLNFAMGRLDPVRNEGSHSVASLLSEMVSYKARRQDSELNWGGLFFYYDSLARARAKSRKRKEKKKYFFFQF
jgi:hypothetical protein